MSAVPRPRAPCAPGATSASSIRSRNSSSSRRPGGAWGSWNARAPMLGHGKRVLGLRGGGKGRSARPPRAPGRTAWARRRPAPPYSPAPAPAPRTKPRLPPAAFPRDPRLQLSVKSAIHPNACGASKAPSSTRPLQAIGKPRGRCLSPPRTPKAGHVEHAFIGSQAPPARVAFPSYEVVGEGKLVVE